MLEFCDRGWVTSTLCGHFPVCTEEGLEVVWLCGRKRPGGHCRVVLLSGCHCSVGAMGGENAGSLG